MQTNQRNNLENKFIGKNFVFDDRLGEKYQVMLLEHVINGGPCDDYGQL